MQVISHKLKAKSYPGFTLIESLVLLFIFALIGVVFLQTYSVGTKFIIESKNRLGATALANQKMEVIRSIEYDAIGTTSGVPAGSLLEDENVDVNTRRYAVHTFVQYVDDAFDGTAGGSGASHDNIPTDYKRVRITVTWGLGGTDQSVVLFGNISPNGVESSTGGGVLAINVLDQSGTGVEGASVHIVNSSAGVNVTGTTDSTGNLTLPGAPVGTEKYVLTISKSGYYGASTYPAYPTSSYNPVDVHASVVANTLNQKTIVMDQSSDIRLTMKDPFDTVVSGIGFSLTGGRVLGTVPVTGVSVLGFTTTGTSNGSGQASYADQSYGNYTLTLTGTSHDLMRVSPGGATSNVFAATAGADTNIDVIVLDKSIGSLKVVVKDQATNNPLSGASVHVTNVTLGYDATVTTDTYGGAYFPTTLPALADGTYDIEVTLSGYTTSTTTETVSGTLQTKTVTLTP